MKIAFDAKRALNNVAGLGQYSRILVNALLRDFPQHEYLLYTPKTKEFLLNEIEGKYNLHFPSSGLSRKLPAYWRSFGITGELIQQQVDIFHGLSNELPLTIHKAKAVKKIVTIHDVIFLKHKDQYSAIDRQIYDYKTRYAARNADRIATISEETKQDLVRFYNIPDKKIEVIQPSCSPSFYKEVSFAEKEKVKAKYKLPASYILNVSSFFTRKNHRAIVEALDKIKDKTDAHVVFIGGQGNIKEEIVALIREKNLDNRIHLLSGVGNEDMPAIYQQAAAFVYPSYYEGFGIPILEALYSRIPVITTHGGCFEEVGGKKTIYIDPSDYNQLSEMILHVLTDENLRSAMIDEGFWHAETMRDSIFAQKMMKLYASI